METKTYVNVRVPFSVDLLLTPKCLDFVNLGDGCACDDK